MTDKQEQDTAGSSQMRELHKQIISNTIGFSFGPNELQSVNADDLLRLAASVSSSAQWLSAEPSEEMLRALFSLNSGTPRTTEEVKQVYEHLHNLSVSELPQVVINLVIAAREFWDVHNDLTDESAALDKALEAFSDRVPYENQPAV